MKKFIYVSHNALNRNNVENPFFAQEKQYLATLFGCYSVVCDRGIYHYNNSGELECKYHISLRNRVKSAFAMTTDANVYKEIHEMIKDQHVSMKNILRVFKYSYDANNIYSLLGRCIDDDNYILYSFWFSYEAYACAKIKDRHPDISVVSRAHAYEIQLKRNSCNPYLMKAYTCKHIDKIAFISRDSLESFKSYYRQPLKIAKILYLGSTKEGAGFIERDKVNVLTILTCSSIVPIKRLDRLIAVLAKWDSSNLHWIHIGDGPDRKKIEEMAADYLDSTPKVSYEFMGNLENKKVHQILRQEDINLFVNVSDSEGVPVSIMEAMSVGLPVVAPRICGIPELVDSNCGFLFSVERAEEEILQALKEYSYASLEDRNKMGRAAYKKWQDSFCLENNLTTLFG